MRISFSKEKRLQIKNKTNGRCGYCGCLLSEKFHIDHIVPVRHGGNNLEANLIVACASCNNYKNVYSVEEFRKQIDLQIHRLNQYSVNYRLAKRYNQLFETPRPIIFYFESLKAVTR
jgi:5-methylcytosine-specific restriction endonuclease McrA